MKEAPVQVITGISFPTTEIKVKAASNVQLKVLHTPTALPAPKYNWISSTPDIVKVSPTGIVEGIKLGEAKITVTTSDNKHSASIKVIVEPILAESVSMDSVSVRILLDQSKKLGYRILPEETTDKSVVFSSSNHGIVSIDSAGLLKAIKLGDAVLSVKTKNGRVGTTKITVLPIKETSLKLSTSSLSIIVGKKATIGAVFTPSNTTNKSLVWTSSDEKIATFDNKGVVTAVSVGTCKVNARSCQGITASADIKVQPIAVQSIQLSKSNVKITVGNEYQLTATIEPQNATYKELEWSTSNQAIATVSKLGKIKAIKPGSCTIQAKTKDGKTALCQVNVQAIAPTAISLDKSSVQIEMGSQNVLTARVQPDNATNKSVLWTTSNSKIASVQKGANSANGVVKGINEGTTTITASTIDWKFKASTTVRVTLKGLQLSKSDLEIGETDSEVVHVTKQISGDPYLYGTWTSENPTVATVKSDGSGTNSAVITGVSKGQTRIIVKSREGKTAFMNVRVKGLEEVVSLSVNPTTLTSTAGYYEFDVSAKLQLLRNGSATIHSLNMYNHNGTQIGYMSNVPYELYGNFYNYLSFRWAGPYKVYGSYENYRSVFSKFFVIARMSINGKFFDVVSYGDPDKIVTWLKNQDTGKPYIHRQLK